MKKTFVFWLLLLNLPVFSIEISLEENKAESGTVGYVDIVKIFNRYALNYKKDFDDEVKKKQSLIDDKKKELNFYKSQKEKLNFEYQMAKMYEDFNKSIISSQNKSTDNVVLDTQTIVLDTETIKSDTGINSNLYLSTGNNLNNLSINKSSASSNYGDIISTSEPQSPYIVMPGVGKIPISQYKFSISSSSLEISKYIDELDKKMQDLDENILELKSKFDDELSKKAAKNNEYILKKIYAVIEDVAKSEGVSVVVDKKNILFGRKTVDLTEKVLKKLEEQ